MCSWGTPLLRILITPMNQLFREGENHFSKMVLYVYEQQHVYNQGIHWGISQ
jgi:hypothetical protein